MVDMSKTKDHVVINGDYLAREARVAVRTFFAPLTALLVAANTLPISPSGRPSATNGTKKAPKRRARGQR